MSRSRVDECIEEGLLGTAYRPIAKIGEGSSSEVFEAVGPCGSIRAVKVLRSIHACLRGFPERIAREGRALAKLNHPNVVRVFDEGLTGDGRPFFVMPCLKGETLRARLAREGFLSPARACALFAGVFSGLSALHAAGIIHRDVKPANIFLATDGRRERSVLFDLGIAKLDGPGIEEDEEGSIIGTPRYVAPEQVVAGHLDERTDVYGSGVVLFEMIAGRSPFDGRDSAEMLEAHLSARPRRLRDLAPVAPDLDYVIARALSKDPARRWPSARAFAVVLARAAAFESVEQGGAEVRR